MLLEFIDFNGFKISIPYHRIYKVCEYILDSAGIKTTVHYDDNTATGGVVCLKEPYQDVVNYIQMGKWETSR